MASIALLPDEMSQGMLRLCAGSALRGKSLVNRNNNFGSLRLLFAALVIASHTPEMLDGNPSRELLYRVVGTDTLGGVGVTGFFVISGFLITRSMAEGRSISVFAVTRLARILPGFLVAFWLCVLCLAPFVTTTPVFTADVLADNFQRSLVLGRPQVPGAFASNPYPELNGSLWTIGWEFTCYVGVGIVGFLGLLNHRFRYLILAGTAFLLALGATLNVNPINWRIDYEAVRFMSIFGVGSCFYLFRDKIRYTAKVACVSFIIMAALLFVKVTSQFALAVFGGYLVFWFSFAVRQIPASRWKNDISYGLYLYGWPVGAVLVWHYPDGNPWILGIATLVIATAFGFLSWIWIEGPMMDLAKAWIARRKAKEVLAGA